MHFEIWSVEICSAGSFEMRVGRRLLTPFLFQITHVHHVRAFINQPVRTDQEEQVPGVFSAASAQVCPQPAPVSGHSVQKQNNPLWYEAGERATQAAGPLRNQGRNLSFSMPAACLSTLWNQSWPSWQAKAEEITFIRPPEFRAWPPFWEAYMQIYAAVN